MGGNFTLESPRPLSCFGFNPSDAFANVYGAASHYCNLRSARAAPPQHSDWINQLDLKVRLQDDGSDRSADDAARGHLQRLQLALGPRRRYEFGDLDVAATARACRPTGHTSPVRTTHPSVYQSPRYCPPWARHHVWWCRRSAAADGRIAPPPPPPPPATQTCPDGSVIAARRRLPGSAAASAAAAGAGRAW